MLQGKGGYFFGPSTMVLECINRVNNDIGIEIRFDLQKLFDPQSSKGPDGLCYVPSGSYIDSRNDYATISVIKVVGESETLVFSTSCDYIDSDSYEKEHGIDLYRLGIEKSGEEMVMERTYAPEGGFEADTCYICRFLNKEKRGLIWRFRTQEEYFLDNSELQEQKIELMQVLLL